MKTSPIACSVCATMAIPGARTPSSLLIRMRYGGGCGRDCCARAGTRRPSATDNTRGTRTPRLLGMAPRVSERGGWTPDHLVDGPGEQREENDGQERRKQREGTGDD